MRLQTAFKTVRKRVGLTPDQALQFPQVSLDVVPLFLVQLVDHVVVVVVLGL